METERERVRKEVPRLLSHKEDFNFLVAVSWCSLASLSGISNNPLDEPENQLDPNNK